jgi:hypothetical protein
MLKQAYVVKSATSAHQETGGETPRKIRIVVDANAMDDDDFIHHMNRRHRDSFGGGFVKYETPDHMAALRHFHDQLHELRLNGTHEHETPWDNI